MDIFVGNNDHSQGNLNFLVSRPKKQIASFFLLSLTLKNLLMGYTPSSPSLYPLLNGLYPLLKKDWKIKNIENSKPIFVESSVTEIVVTELLAQMLFIMLV